MTPADIKSPGSVSIPCSQTGERSGERRGSTVESSGEPTQRVGQLVVIAGSAGAFEAVKSILRSLPQDFTVPVVMVLHRGGDKNSSRVPWDNLPVPTWCRLSRAADWKLGTSTSRHRHLQRPDQPRRDGITV